MSSKRISIILLLIIVYLLILFLMCKMNHKHSKNEHFNQVIKKNQFKLHDVFKFLKDLKLPKEMEARYAYTLKAKNPNDQAVLENKIATLLDEKFILDEDDLKNITDDIELDNNGLIQSIDYYRAVIDFIKVTDAVNDFKKKVRDGLVNGYNQQ